MELLLKFILFVHLLGMAYLLGSLLMQINVKKKKINRGIIDGALTQLVTGALMYWILLTNPEDEPINHMVVGLKIVLLAIILVVIAFKAKAKFISGPTYFLLLAASLGAIALAVLL